MNREIKFRVFSTWQKMMYGGLVEGIQWRASFDKDGTINVEHGCHIMQYTGRNDKNEKEIYEGDIVKAVELGIDEHFMQTDEVWSERLAEVFWDDLLAGWGLRGESFERGCEPLTHLDRFEVVGNIYETPELLNSVRDAQGSVATGDDSNSKVD